MSREKYMVLDTETGGLNSKDCSLLTAYFGVFSHSNDLQGELSLSIKPDDGIYAITSQALKINGIDLTKHDAIAMTESASGVKLFNFLNQHSDGGNTKLIPVGHNINFDLEFIYNHLITKEGWEKFVSYRTMDTHSIANFLKFAGKLPQSSPTSLGGLARALNIRAGGDLHNARTDALLTWDLLQALKNAV